MHSDDKFLRKRSKPVFSFFYIIFLPLTMEFLFLFDKQIDRIRCALYCTNQEDGEAGRTDSLQ